MRAFIIRPFGKKNEIDFDGVERLLIAPALKRIGAEGGTTIDIVEAGNIRLDMFRRLLAADLVVADLSIHNANVFYELGVRHALRDQSTFMLRCEADRFPFDLQTDRYFIYSKDDPGARLEDLVAALRQTIDSSTKDSPIFVSLPELREPDPSHFMAIPLDFGEEVQRAVGDKRAGDLALLAYEAGGFEWEMKGWRTVGRAQFDLRAYASAKFTWEAVRKLEPFDLEANLLLGTIYERLGDLTRSTQALERALDNKQINRDERAEAYALLARNAKTCWRGDWERDASGERTAAALRSPHLRASFDYYKSAFDEDLNHFYSGLNALAMLSIMIELAESLPEVWGEPFETNEKAEDALGSYRKQAAKLASAVEVSLDATLGRLRREGRKDVWAEISAADLRFITSKRPARVAAAYRDALAGAPDFARDAVRKQLAVYKDLGVLAGSLAEVVKVVGESQGEGQSAPQRRRKRVLLFAGHMVDAPGREHARFPADKEAVAREKIKETVVREMSSGAGVACGYSGGASGGDILFHEVCAELGIPTRLYLALPPPKYVKTSVQKAGPQWVERFWALLNERYIQEHMRVLSEAADEREYLPAWLRPKRDYSIWQRNNLWMLFNALDEGCDPRTGEPNITLIALWDGEGGDNDGGTGDLVERVEGLGARCEIIKTKELFS
jgi:tetratricopeptide (TPR) repeat protein